MRLIRFATVAVTCGAVMLGSSMAHAQVSAEARTAAESLFREGRRLMDEGKTPEGCRKLEESFRLDPASGTLLNLGVCHEKEGKIATAWGEFSLAVSMARQDKRPDREELAQGRANALEPLLPKVTIDVPAEARANGLEVLKNGTVLGSGAWGASLPTDPGDVTVEARAPGRKPWRSVVKVEPKGTMSVAVPALQIEEIPLVPVAGGEDTEGARPNQTKRTAALVAGGVGIVALGVGTVFGIQTFSKKSESDTNCPEATGCTQQGVDAADAAKTSATIANIGIGVGVAAVAVGAYLWFTSGPSKPPTTPAAALGLKNVDVAYGVDGRSPGATILGRW